jgi:hypothetical protein
MGAPAGPGQRTEVRKALEALSASADIVFGSPDTVEVLDADPERGAFLSPVLLRARPGAVEPHDVEPFGPVSTVLSYASVADAVALAARGRGSLAGSLVTADPAVAREVVRGVAPWHGRVLVLDAEAAPDNTGHGTPMPTLVHGGPGRAGGGEELGGIRGVLHHMQRTAVQGSPAMLDAIPGRSRGTTAEPLAVRSSRCPGVRGSGRMTPRTSGGRGGPGMSEQFDVIVVGAGFAGLYAIHTLRQDGFTVRAFETGDGVGGTWYWNRHPGARGDVESIDYQYSFSRELIEQWQWSERYPAQAEILRYLNHVADRFDLRRDIQLGTTVTATEWDEQVGRWNVQTDRGDRVTARYLILVGGALSQAKEADLSGTGSSARVGPTPAFA